MTESVSDNIPQSKPSSLLNHWPIAAGILALLFAFLFDYQQAVSLTNGKLVYTLDDAYIHMAIAKNIAGSHIFGVTSHGFTGASSSPLWTWMLGGIFAVIGVKEILPLVLNLLFAIGTMIALYWGLRKLFPNGWDFAVFIMLLLIIHIANVRSLIFGGMEHNLQLMTVAWFTVLASVNLSSDQTKAISTSEIWLWVSAFIMTGTRYEGLFLLFPVVVFYAIRRRFLPGLILLAVGLIPVIGHGVYSLSQGGNFLPNSLLVKGNVPLYTPAGLKLFFMKPLTRLGFGEMLSGYYVVVMTIISLIFFIRNYDRDKFWSPRQVLTAIFIIGLVFHSFLANPFTWRYDQYMILLGGLLVCSYLLELLPRELYTEKKLPAKLKLAAIILLVLISAGPLIGASQLLITNLAVSCRSIHDQQIQMAGFVSKYYSNKTVVLNDIGAVNFYADIDCFDWAGLANNDVVLARQAGQYDNIALDDMTRNAGAKIAIAYEEWLNEMGGAPPSWVKVGEWIIPTNNTTGSDSVSIYAVDPNEAGQLIQNLRDFSGQLPPTVEQKGLYTEPSK